MCDDYCDWALNTQEFCLLKLGKLSDEDFMDRLRLIMVPIVLHVEECTKCDDWLIKFGLKK